MGLHRSRTATCAARRWPTAARRWPAARCSSKRARCRRIIRSPRTCATTPPRAARRRRRRAAISTASFRPRLCASKRPRHPTCERKQRRSRRESIYERLGRPLIFIKRCDAGKFWRTQALRKAAGHLPRAARSDGRRLRALATRQRQSRRLSYGANLQLSRCAVYVMNSSDLEPKAITEVARALADDQLRAGKTLTLTLASSSMAPPLAAGDRLRVRAARPADLRAGDILLRRLGA